MLLSCSHESISPNANSSSSSVCCVVSGTVSLDYKHDFAISNMSSSCPESNEKFISSEELSYVDCSTGVDMGHDNCVDVYGVRV